MVYPPEPGDFDSVPVESTNDMEDCVSIELDDQEENNDNNVSNESNNEVVSDDDLVIENGFYRKKVITQYDSAIEEIHSLRERLFENVCNYDKLNERYLELENSKRAELDSMKANYEIVLATKESLITT